MGAPREKIGWVALHAALLKKRRCPRRRHRSKEGRRGGGGGKNTHLKQKELPLDRASLDWGEEVEDGLGGVRVLSRT